MDGERTESRPPVLGVVGLGAVGTAFAHAARERGVEVRCWSRSWERRERARRMDGLTVDEDLEDLAQRADLLLLCVAEAALPELVERLGALPARCVAHTAGALTARALAPLDAQGWSLGACHPVRPIPVDRPKSLLGSALAISGDERALELLSDLARRLGLESLRLADDSAARDRYHAACALLANGMVGLSAAAERLIAESTDDVAGARSAVRSLLAGTLENLRDLDPAHALTGPVQRGDVERVARHLAALRGSDAALYREVAAALLPLVVDDLEPARRAALERLLDPGADA